MSTHKSGTSNTKEAPEKAQIDVAGKAAIEQFKRSGEFDTIRKDTLRKWEASEDGVAFRLKLQGIINKEVERDPSLLARDRGKAATLVGGAVERTQLYPEARLAAAKNIFQSKEMKDRIYESLKKYMPETSMVMDGSDSKSSTVVNAQEAARAFIDREQGA